MSILLTSGFPNFMAQEAHAAATLVSVTTTSTTTIDVVFSENVSTEGGGAPPVGDWTVGGIIPQSINDIGTTPSTTITLTMAASFGTGGVPTVIYTGPTGATQIESAIDLADILDINQAAVDGVAPIVSSAATTSSTTIDLTMSESVTNDSALPGDFTIGGVVSTPTVTGLTPGIAASGTTITLTLDAAIVNGESPTVTYTLNGRVIDDGATGNQLAAFAGQAVTNNVASVVVPEEKKKGGGGCDGDCTTPTIGLDKNGVRLVDNGFSYNNNVVDAVLFHTPFPLISAHVGQTNTVSIKAWENSGPQGITLTQIGLGVPEIGSPLNDAEVIIEVWLSNTDVEKTVIVDPHNLIENSSVSAQTDIVNCRVGSDAQCLDVTLNYMYREAPLYNVMSVEVMDMSRNVQSTTFNDGVEVLGDSMNPADTFDVVPQTPQNYPQRSGTVLLTQIDRAEQMWVDPYGYLWQGDNSKMTLISEIPFVRFQDSESEFTGYNSRLNSNFEMYKEEQIDSAQMVFDYLTSYKQIQGDDLTDYVAKTFDNVPLERADNVKLQQDIISEQVRAAVTFEQILDSSFVPKN